MIGSPFSALRAAGLPGVAPCALALAAALALGAPARAERADRDKPLQVESDRLEYDDLKQVNVFIGNVTLTKGTLIIRGDRVVVRQDPEGYQFGDAYGKPATFRQKRDAPGDQWIEGWAERLEYDGKQDTVRLHDRAALRRLEDGRITDEVYGALITYDSRTEFFTVDGGGRQAATGNNPNGRVRVVIQPRQTDASAAPPSASVPLQPARGVANPRESRPPVPPADVDAGASSAAGAAPAASAVPTPPAARGPRRP